MHSTAITITFVGLREVSKGLIVVLRSAKAKTGHAWNSQRNIMQDCKRSKGQ